MARNCPLFPGGATGSRRTDLTAYFQGGFPATSGRIASERTAARRARVRLLARAFDALDRPDSALAHYVAAAHIERDCCFPTTAGIVFPLAPGYRRIGELAENRGDALTARQYYGAFLALWEDAEPALQPQLADVRARVARLGLPR